MAAVDSLKLLKIQWMVWKLVGMNSEEIELKKLYTVYTFANAFFVLFFLPIHFLFGIFKPGEQMQKLQLIAVAFSSVASSLKLLSYIRNYRKIRVLESVLKQLDRNITHFEDILLFENMYRRMRKIDVVLCTVSAITCITCSLAILFQNNEQLLYNGWLPFDYKTSDLKFNIAKYYQLIAIAYAIVHNYISDRFSIIAFYQLSAHVTFLHKRISRIGHDQENNVENAKYFRSCIIAQQRLNELCTQIEDITTFPIFLQFTVTGITACLTLTLAVFYTEDNMTRLYFLFYAMVVLLGIFPVCYFGSELEYRFEQLHWSIYFSDWTRQSMSFKKDMLIFNERSLKHRAFFAGGILRIHLPTFLSTCKGAYSLFAVVLRFKNDKTVV